MFLLAMGIILSGCVANRDGNYNPTNTIPVSLSDPITYGELSGHYGRPLPTAGEPLKVECSERGRDVVMLITTIKLKNHELEGIRMIDETKFP